MSRFKVGREMRTQHFLPRVKKSSITQIRECVFEVKDREEEDELKSSRVSFFAMNLQNELARVKYMWRINGRV